MICTTAAECIINVSDSQREVIASQYDGDLPIIYTTYEQREAIAAVYNASVIADHQIDESTIDYLMIASFRSLLAKYGNAGIMLQSNITIGGSPQLITVTLNDVTVNKDAVFATLDALADDKVALAEVKALSLHVALLP